MARIDFRDARKALFSGDKDGKTVLCTTVVRLWVSVMLECCLGCFWPDFVSWAMESAGSALEDRYFPSVENGRVDRKGVNV